jgi:ribonuclease P protein component
LFLYIGIGSRERRVTQLLQRAKRLNKDKDIKRVLKKGIWINGRFATIHYLPGDAPMTRWGIVVSKRVGGAVTRNRARRKLREACRELDPRMDRPWDLVVIGRKGSDEADYMDIIKDLERLCLKGRLF